MDTDQRILRGRMRKNHSIFNTEYQEKHGGAGFFLLQNDFPVPADGLGGGNHPHLAQVQVRSPHPFGHVVRKAVRRAREERVPYLGVCLGLQVAVCEFARDICGLTDASSAEFDPQTPHPVIDIMPDQAQITEKRGTMRLGAYPCKVLSGTLAEEAYGEPLVYERHRHRFEVNNAYRDQLVEAGLVISGLSPDGRLVEMVELPEEVHPWFVASQAHPEFKSRPDRPAPLFREFVRAAIARHEGVSRHDVRPVDA